MNIKRFITFFSLLAGFFLLTLNVYAEKIETADNFSYETTSDTTVTLTGIKNNIYYDLVLPDSLLFDGKRYEITRIGKKAFAANALIESVKVGKYITMIEDNAFTDCTSLKAVNFSQSVDSIGEWVFYGCTRLTTIELPSQLMWMGKAAFYGCTGLKSVIVPNKVKQLSSNLFCGCTELFSVTLPEELSVIDTAAFGSCGKLTTIRLPEKLTRISNYAFDKTSLTTITIPAGVKEIDTNPFSGCKTLERIEVKDGNSILSSVDGILFSKDKKRLIAWPQVKADEAYTVPDGTETIGAYAFYYAKNLTSITLPESITDLGEYAFAYTQIQSIVVPDKVTELKEGVFAYTYLTDITLGKQMAVIHERALYASMIQYIYIAATTPPLYPSYSSISQTTLYVPKGAYDAYYAVSPWRSVSKIIESASVVRFYPVSCTTEGGYTRISLSNRTSGYSAEGDRNVFMSVIAGDSVKLYVDGSGGYHMPPPIPIKQVFLNGVDVTEKNEESSRYIFRYNAKADGPLHFYILFGYATGIQSPEIKQSNVYTSAQHIIIRATENNLPVFIYDIMGRLVHQSIIQEGDRYIPVHPGLYVVKVKDKTEKVVVRK